MVKKILVTISTAAIARNILRSEVLRLLLLSKNKIILVVPADKHDAYRSEFTQNTLEIYKAPLVVQSFYDRLLSFLARNAFFTETVRMWQIMEFRWNHDYIIYITKRLLMIALGRSSLFHMFLRFLYKKSTPLAEATNLIKKINPDLLFITDAFVNTDVIFWKAAMRMNIPVVAMIRSWDNLTNHGLIRMVPDKLIVHNPFLKNLATNLHHIPESKISIVGLPHYDWNIKKELFLTREEFCEKIGVDFSKKLILFAGIGDYLAPHDWEVVRILSRAIEGESIRFPVNILFRPHPAFALINQEKIGLLPHIIFDHRILKSSSGTSKRGEMTEEDMAHLLNSLKHADLVVTTASSITIDAVAFDRPVICIGFDGESREPYWNSVLRYYRDFTHYKFISETGGFKIAYDKERLVQYVNEYLENPKLDKEGRKKIFEDFIWKIDGKSSDRLAESILTMFEKK